MVSEKLVRHAVQQNEQSNDYIFRFSKCKHFLFLCCSFYEAVCCIFMTIQAHLMTVGVISAQKKMLSVLTA